MAEWLSWTTIRRVLIAIPAIGLCTAAYTWLTLPDIRPLRTANPQTTAFMARREAETRSAGKPVHRQQQWVSFDRISKHLVRAVLLTEDAGFYSHEGVDYGELRAAIEDTVERGEPLRGASTITQQLAKNLYLTPSRDPYRKLSELLLARRLEAELSKRRILELYLNVIEWGDSIWGVGAAARIYFDESADDLSEEEAALLAGAISNPRRFNPAKPDARLKRIQAIILRKMGR